MCIRDRNEILESYGGAVESRPGTGIKLELSGEERERLMNSAYMMELMAVSYTHLDTNDRFRPGQNVTEREGEWEMTTFPMISYRPVSYTHLDVYKRQERDSLRRRI